MEPPRKMRESGARKESARRRSLSAECPVSIVTEHRTEALYLLGRAILMMVSF
jgi:hypothetical protein